MLKFDEKSTMKTSVIDFLDTIYNFLLLILISFLFIEQYESVNKVDIFRKMSHSTCICTCQFVIK